MKADATIAASDLAAIISTRHLVEDDSPAAYYCSILPLSRFDDAHINGITKALIDNKTAIVNVTDNDVTKIRLVRMQISEVCCFRRRFNIIKAFVISQCVMI